MDINLSTIEDLERRFWSKVDIKNDEECWNWQAGIQGKGYGSFGIRRGRTQLAHRVAYFLKKGPIPVGLVVMHKCDNRLCCNPNHLKLGTIADNNRDAVAKGRNAKGEQNGNAKLTGAQVGEIRDKRKLGGYTASQLAKLYKVSESNIYRIVSNNKYWKLPLVE